MASFWIVLFNGLLALGTLSICLFPNSAYSQGPFYQGKTITIIQGRDPGGTGDLRVRALVPFLQKYIPGNPTIVNEYMPGGGSRNAANHLYRSARPDGLTIGNLSAGMVSLAVLGETGVLYDIDKLFYLGSPYSTYHSVFLTRKQAGLDTIEKLRAASGIRIGAQSVGFSTYNEARLFAYILGLKDPKFIAAYAGAEIDPALIRGEIDARATGADSVLQRNKEWLKGGVVDFHAIVETPKGDKHPDFSGLPEIESFARSDKERKLIILQRAFRVSGTPFVLPPGTPKDRVEILQEAFRKTYKDPEFLKEYKKLTRDDATPLLPEAHEKTIREIPREREVIELFKKLVGADPLPPR
ncbi:MAG: Bug family tripartite tricarboxylate transporter substrate binding protein [Candidatus Binatia bacterium]